MEQFVNYIKDILIIWGPKVLAAIVILIIGLRVIAWISKVISRSFEKRQVDQSVFRFLVSIINVLLKVMLLLTVASQVGIPTTSFVAIISASALAIGLALSGNLSHFASGVLILIFKPYKVGDLVKIGDFTGHVAEIQIFNTVLLTNENKKVIIPNSTVTGGPIVNISSEGKLRCDLSISIDSSQNLDKARQIIMELMGQNPAIVKDPYPAVHVNNLTPNSTEFAVHPWIHPDDYWQVYFGLQEAIKQAFAEQGILGPQNRLNVLTAQ